MQKGKMKCRQAGRAPLVMELGLAVGVGEVSLQWLAMAAFFGDCSK